MATEAPLCLTPDGRKEANQCGPEDVALACALVSER